MKLLLNPTRWMVEASQSCPSPHTRCRPVSSRDRSGALFDRGAAQATAQHVSQSRLFDSHDHLAVLLPNGEQSLHQIHRTKIVDVLDRIVEKQRLEL